MKPALVVVITGHPATGKTTLAQHVANELHLPLIGKDQIKELLLDSLGWSTPEWSRQLGVATYRLLYQQVETLLKAGVPHLVEANFDPVYANEQWQRLVVTYSPHLIQIRCETEPETLLARYRDRILAGRRHPGHVDQSDDLSFQEMVHAGPLGWLAVESDCLSVDTTVLSDTMYAGVVEKVRELLPS